MMDLEVVGRPSVIRLGRSTSGQEVYMPYPYFKTISGARMPGASYRIITGMTRSGKSMVTRIVIYHMAKDRQVIVFDWAGKDHYHGYQANKDPRNLPPGAQAEGLKGYYFYYRVKGERQKKKYWEIEVTPSFAKYNYEQIESTGISPSSSKYLSYVIKEYGPFKSIHTLYDFISKYPTNKAEIPYKMKQGVNASQHDQAYREGDMIPAQSHTPLVRDLQLKILEKGVWGMDARKDLDMKKAILSGQHLIFSFHDDVLARAEISYFIQQLKETINENPRMPRPHLFFEEAHKIMGSQGTTLDEAFEQFILVLGKLGVGADFTLPTLQPLNSEVKDQVRDWIVGCLKGDNLNKLVGQIPRAAINNVRTLPSNRFASERLFLYYSEDFKRWGVFNPYECPQEYNRQT